MGYEGKVAILGGDKRMRAAADRLQANGWQTAVWGVEKEATGDWTEAVKTAEAVILPLPTSADGVRIHTPTVPDVGLRFSTLLREMRKGSVILGGRLPDFWAEQAEASGVRIEDYYDDPLLQLKNALPTAEGALLLAMNALPVTLSGCEVAVIGYGRIASLLAEKLKALDAAVTVFARNPADLAHAELRGLQAIRLEKNGEASSLTRISPACRMIFNTVPYRIFSESTLRRLPKRCILMELASLPGGFDPAAAERLGLTVLLASALPGKYFPETAGILLGDVLSARLQVLLDT